jgi:hypothetical protein
VSDWTHPMCDPCWVEEMGLREPVRMARAAAERCCWCAAPTRSGIYMREDPAKLDCEGIHEPQSITH